MTSLGGNFTKRSTGRFRSASRWFALIILLFFCLLPEIAEAEDAAEPKPLWTAAETRLVAGALVGAGALSLVDEEVRDEVERHRRRDLKRIADSFDLLGHPAVTLGIGGILYGAGRVRGDDELTQTGRLAVEAVLIAEAATVALKAAVGRERPDRDGDAGSFRPLQMEEDHDSFPSAHTSGAFALAAVLARRSSSPRAPYLYYGLASLVALSRVYNEEHWASDVAVGALIGELSARLLVRSQEERDGWLWGAAPAVSGGALITLTRRW